MAIRIGSNISALSAQRFLAKAGDGVARISEQLSSGLRINRASDDAAGLAISTALNADSRIAGQALRNVNDGISVTAIAKGALEQLSNVVIRQKELAEQAANGAYSSTQRTAMEKEARALTDEYNRIVLSTEFNGQSLFTQNWRDLVIQSGTGTENAVGFALGDDIASKLTPGSYFTVNFDGTKTVVWFNIDGQGAQPVVAADCYRSVSLNTQDSSRLVDLQMDNEDYSSWSWDESAYCLGYKDSTEYYLWFDPGGGSAPSWFDTEDVGIAVDVSSVSTKEDLAQAITQAINEAGILFTAADLGGGAVRLSTSETGYVGSAFDEGAYWISATQIQAGVARDSTQDVLEKVSAVMTSMGLSCSVEGGTMLKVTGSRSGDYGDAVNVTSNVYVSQIQDGSGLAVYDLAGSGWASNVTLADLNNDGNLDMAAATYLSSKVVVRFGNGDGTFGSAAAYTTSGRNEEITAGDMDGDGDADLVVADFLSLKISVLQNRGDGSFSLQQSITVSCKPSQIELGDFDGDGVLEVAAAGFSTGGGGLSILENDGGGNLTVSHQYASTDNGGFSGLIAGDIDGDGLLDLGTTSDYFTGVRIWKGDGQASFSPVHTYSLGVLGALDGGDLDGDGDLDLVARDQSSSNAVVLFNNGQGDFTTTRTITGELARGIKISDVNGDGMADLVGTHNTSMFIALNNGGGNFSTPVSYTMGVNMTGLAVADINGDGSRDVVSVDHKGGGPMCDVRLRLNNGDGTFYSSQGDRKEAIWLSFGDPRGRVDVEHLDLSTRSGALAAIGMLTQRLDRLNQEIGGLGANESRLETTISRLAVDRENFDAAVSRITDIDVAHAAAQLVQQQILRQIGTTILAQANQAPLLAVQLLRTSSRF